jgi:hypothetical protein
MVRTYFQLEHCYEPCRRSGVIYSGSGFYLPVHSRVGSDSRSDAGAWSKLKRHTFKNISKTCRK